MESEDVERHVPSPHATAHDDYVDYIHTGWQLTQFICICCSL